ncbi:MAG: endonuclease/exonuclease/phosphatase family protein [Luteolibacter sp.]|uniref:endonuclease/exonuclease/phosphatase family protein n=1 Tax=Luteolibacter sp. TaxID=1962973 RepID=UPI0032663490
MSSFSRRLGWTLVVISLLLHIFTVYCYSRQPDRFAAFTVMPIWLWGGFGLLLSSVAFYFLRASLSLIMTGVWAITLLVGADEARVLANFGKSPPLPGQAELYEGKPVLRVLTLNCAANFEKNSFTYGDPSIDIAAWQPDIVLLQDILPNQVRQIADVLYGGRGDYRAHLTNGIVTRWKIQQEVRDPTRRDEQVTILCPNGEKIEVVNVHLLTAATDLRLWHKSAWTDHRTNRAIRMRELSVTRAVLKKTTNFPETPTIFGGDFNSPASDIVHRQLGRDFVDAFAAAGTGWGDTFQRRFPILRIDLIYATRHFVPVRCRVVASKNSDHRMVVADFLTVPAVSP